MQKPKKTNKTKANPLQELKGFLDEEFKPKPQETKPPKMHWEEMEKFHKQKILPAFKKLKQQLSEYKFESITYELHTRIAIFKISSQLYLFHFKIDIDNADRQIKIFYRLRYRLHRKKRLTEIKNLESQQIAFTDIKSINEELILSLFAKWFMSKDELIEKDKVSAE